MLEELICERIQIRGSSGALAGELRYTISRVRFAVLLVNPHPHMGGRTGNNLMVQLAEALAASGGVTLCFDYAGVGESEGDGIDVASSMSRFWRTGHAPEDPRMVADTCRVREWMRSNARLPLVLLGYSFGAYAATIALTDEVHGLVLISPTIEQHDFSRLAGRHVTKLIIYSDNDFASSQGAFEAWIHALPPPTTARCITGGVHFFRGQEGEVATACASFVETTLQPDTPGHRS